jgi:G protein beta subunit-like protein
MSDSSPSSSQEQQNYAQMQQYQQSLQNDSHSVILVTAGYDNTIRFWEALSGICSRTIQHADSVMKPKVLYLTEPLLTTHLFFSLNYNHQQVNRLCISPDKTILAAAGITQPCPPQSPHSSFFDMVGNHNVRLYDISSSNGNPVSPVFLWVPPRLLTMTFIFCSWLYLANIRGISQPLGFTAKDDGCLRPAKTDI